MTSRSKVDWRVPATEWEAFEDFIHEKYGEIEGYVGREVESAMREWVDMDRGSDAEKTLDRLVRAAGRRPADLEGKKPPSSDRFVDADTTRVSCYVHSDVRAGFTSVVDETDDRLGVALARALSEYRQGGRDARLEQKLERIADDAEDLLSEISDDADPEAGLPIREKRTVAICNRLGPSFTEDDLDEAIASVAGDSQATLEHYRERVIDRLGCAQHPNNPRVYIPRQEAERIAEEFGLPGPDAPAIDRKPYRDLSREEKVEGLRLELARKAHSRNGSASVTVSKVHDGIFDGKGSKDHIRGLMDEAAEYHGYSMERSATSGKEYITVNLDAVSRSIRKQLTTDDQGQDTEQDQDQDQDPADESSDTEGDADESSESSESSSEIESDAAERMNQIMDSQSARTDGGRDVN